MFERLLRPGLVALGLTAAILATSPAEARTLNEILSAGQIQIGLSLETPPQSSYDDKNQPTGFEVEIAKQLAEKLGVKLVIVKTGSPDRIPFVASGKIDAVMGAMTRNSARAKVIDFTVPLYTENYGIITTQNSPITGLADLNNENITLVEVRGINVIPFLQKNAPKAKMILLDNYNDRDRALAQGRGNASFDSIDSAPFRLKLYPDVKWKIIPSPEWGVTFDCIGIAKGNSSLKDWLNLAIYEMHADGTIEALWKQYFLAPMATKVPFTPYF